MTKTHIRIPNKNHTKNHANNSDINPTKNPIKTQNTHPCKIPNNYASIDTSTQGTVT